MGIKKELTGLFDNVPEQHLTALMLIIAAIIIIVALTGRKVHKAILTLYLVI